MMTSLTLQQLIPVIQTAVGPVILISGVGLLMLSMTTRLGRIIDRSRMLVHDLVSAPPSEHERLIAQLKVLYRRARIIRLVIILATASVLLAGVLVISLFLAALLDLDAALFVIFCFILCVASLIVSLLLFLIELQMALRALQMELDHTGATEK